MSNDSNDAIVNEDSNYVVTFETTATVTISLKVKAADQQQAMADGFAYASTADLSQFKVKSAHVDSLVNVGVDKDTAADLAPGGFSVKWVDNSGQIFKQQDSLVYEDAKSLVEAILTDNISKEVEAAVYEASTGRRIMSGKAPRGGFEVVATPIIPADAPIRHTWIKSKAEASAVALGLHRKKVYSNVKLFDLSDREKDPVLVLCVE